ncbi:MAG: PUA domain-containing protein, partial [Nanopusillaceae archaeon]
MTLSTIKAILNYQFGDKVGDKIIEKYKENIKLEISKSTGRIRRIYINNNLFGTVEPSTGFIIPTFFGGEIIKTFLPFPKYRVIVSEEAIPFVLDGKSVFCKFVIDLDNNILPEDVVFVVDRKDNLLAIGISKLSSEEIKRFKRGVAIKIK